MPSNTTTPVLYALGSNGSGQLGIGLNQDVSIPREVLFRPGSEPSSPVVQIAAGGNHTLLLTADGKLYWAGDSSTGACGPLSQEAKAYAAKFIAQEVALPNPENDIAPPVKFIAATWESSIVVQSSTLYTFGAGQKGELGLGQFIVRTPTPTALPSFPPPSTGIVDIAACMSHAVVVLDNGEVWGWGNGRKGQLGPLCKGVAQEPVKVEGLEFKAVKAVCGREFTALFGSRDTGEVCVLGTDKAGVQSSAPERALGWRDVGATWGGVYILNEDGTLLSWGKDDHGQLAPPGLPKLAKLAVGSEHVVALTEDGDVISWGWGEHGNCGPQVENNDVKGRWNTIASQKYIPPGSKITAIGAGCATSWVSLELARQP
ncbi:alpha tubulin suppressor [Gnomoniopsis smithogilvyi]|uniref:Alpha tubulin suppressor n=1 Tax=Gnomoniopsis smithogilvyi TaxID=1191159 RepID=A0A9W8YUJ6_9PEZI|nr:alpha tubulin suppressor [Gnomoniopsis smithogilvyi]